MTPQIDSNINAPTASNATTAADKGRLNKGGDKQLLARAASDNNNLQTAPQAMSNADHLWNGAKLSQQAFSSSSSLLGNDVEVLSYQDDGNGLQLISPNLYSDALSSSNPNIDGLAQYYEYLDPSVPSTSLSTPLSNFYLQSALDQDRHAISTPTSPSQFLSGSSFGNFPSTMSTPTAKPNRSLTQSTSASMAASNLRPLQTNQYSQKLTNAQRMALASLSDPNYKSPSPTQSSEQRRQMHIECEKKRRNQIKNGFDELKMEIPGLVHKKVSKAVLLIKAIDFVRVLKQERDVLALEVDRLRSQLNQQ
ncbi:hypothetical protein MIR68_006896 [Amoeboaphelidium protococcarum]|nr:hypothetical protein MIR68_006896 [Amoeboaphelidium protococcarum]